jgi:8-oxo-dGTP pyrophosphatase MutT (NUDIX family)
MRVPTPLCRLAYRSAHTALLAYWFILRPRVRGVKCVLTDGELVLLVRHTYGRPDWDLPGGTVKRNEPPLHAARREMSEELGVTIADWVSVGELLTSAHHRRDTIHCFQVELRDPQFTIDPCELAAVHWFPRRDLPPRLSDYVRPILARLGSTPTQSSPEAY